MKTYRAAFEGAFFSTGLLWMSQQKTRAEYSVIMRQAEASTSILSLSMTKLKSIIDSENFQNSMLKGIDELNLLALEVETRYDQTHAYCFRLGIHYGNLLGVTTFGNQVPGSDKVIPLYIRNIAEVEANLPVVPPPDIQINTLPSGEISSDVLLPIVQKFVEWLDTIKEDDSDRREKIIYGDIVYGDKVGGDKVAGNKVEVGSASDVSGPVNIAGGDIHVSQNTSTLLKPKQKIPRESQSSVTQKDKRMSSSTKRFFNILVGICTIIACIAAVMAIPQVQQFLRPDKEDFSYQVRVQRDGTGEIIKNAKLIVEVPGNAPLVGYTDSNGYGIIFVDASYVGKPGRLRVEASGYEPYLKEMDIRKNTLPEEVYLIP